MCLRFISINTLLHGCLILSASPDTLTCGYRDKLNYIRVMVNTPTAEMATNIRDFKSGK